MANKNIFKSTATAKFPVTDTVNEAGGAAYSMKSEAALAQLACTGTFNGTYYSTAETQLETIKKHLKKCSTEFIAKLAIYSRQEGFMKDAPALLLAEVFNRDVKLFEKIFTRVVDNGKMLRNFCQIVRSGELGRKSFGSAGKRAIQNWLVSKNATQLLNESVGNDPSLVDIIKMVHPKAVSDEQNAMFAYLLGKKYSEESLPEVAREFESFKKGMKDNRNFPEKVNFQLLTALDLSEGEWKKIAENMGWHATRMNLNTFDRHSVFSDERMVDLVANKLRNEKAILASKVFPYQLLVAYENSGSVPTRIRNALQDAMEVATRNVPSLKGKIYIAVDCSGSMTCPVTGTRKGATTKVNCNQVASLIAASFLRTGEDRVEVLRFDTQAQILSLNSRDSIMTNAQKIGTYGGGTDCAAPIRLLNSKGRKGDMIIVLSDNQSWYQSNIAGERSTMMDAWRAFKKQNQDAKLVCVDLAPYTTIQVPTSKNVLNVGGWSDEVFEVIDAFNSGTDRDTEFWTNKIKSSVNL